MVKHLSPQDAARIADAITKAEQDTNAEIVLVVASTSDLYFDFVLGYGILLSSLMSLALYSSGAITNFFALQGTQLIFLLLLCGVPLLRRIFLRLIPIRIFWHRTAQRALKEFHMIHRQLPATSPIALMFVSLNERYAHIISSHAVYAKIPDERWATVIHDFTAKISELGLAQSCIAAVGAIGRILAPHFPDDGKADTFSNRVREKL